MSTFPIDKSAEQYIEERKAANASAQVTGPHDDGTMHLWSVDSGVVSLDIVKAGDEKNCQVKMLSENEVPAALDCPLGLLEQAGPPNTEAAQDWRDMVQRFGRSVH